jgi:hypothetical protein
MMDFLVLTKFQGFFHISKDNYDSDEYETDIRALADELKPIFEKYGFKYQDVVMELINMKKHSICQCESCSSNMVNRTLNPQGYGDHALLLNDGATFEGKTLCEMCLPEDHRWGS